MPPSNYTSQDTGCSPWRLPSAVLVVLLVGTACVSSRPPVLEGLRDREERTPVVLIPGISGTRLRDPESGDLRWGNSRVIFFPRDGGENLAVPINDKLENRLEPDGPVEEIRLLGILRFEFYRALIRLMTANGYQLGDLKAPRPDDTFFVFGYDWRLGNVEATQGLAQELEGLRRARGGETLTVTLLCQSNAGRIARYFQKYGGASLEEAEAQASGEDPVDRHGVDVDKVIFLGTDNGGAFSPFRDLHEGRTYLPLFGRRFRPETLFTLASLFETLPVYRRDLFFDEEGQLLDIDFADAENWQRYQWSIFRPDVERRLAKLDAPSPFGSLDERLAYLADALDQSRRIQALLARDVRGFGDTRYYMVQSDDFETEERALLVEDDEGWHTYLGDHRRVRRDPKLRALAIAPGDGHATLDSQTALSDQEKEAVEETVFVEAPHRRIILHPETRRRLLDFLAR